MKIILNIFLLLFPFFLFSCKNDTTSTAHFLAQAQELIEKNPMEALALLDSIKNPETMDKDNYMQYIVTYVGARYEAKEDIKNDTLILVAQSYFNNTENHKISALANYYAAQLYEINGNFPKVLESYMYAVDEASKSNNNLIAGRGFNNIGYIYYEQDLFDSAIVNYQKALSYYDKVENTEDKKLRTLTYLGRAYEENNQPDSAYLYYNKSLDKAIKTNNEKYRGFSLQNLGVLCYKTQEYEKAIQYFQTTLSLPATDSADIRKMQIGMLMIYNKKQDLESAKQYVDLVTASLPKVTYIYTTKEMYGALAEYYKLAGNYKDALRYTNLEIATKNQIKKENNTAGLLDADKSFYLTQKKKKNK